jgi:hypothetical protein
MPTPQIVPLKQTPEGSPDLLQDPPLLTKLELVVVLLLQYVPRGQMVQAEEPTSE